MSKIPSKSAQKTSLTAAQICHHIRGRVRLRIPDRRGDIDYFTLLQQKFASLDGVQLANVNPSTASLLIGHSLGMDRLADYARAENLFDLTTNPPVTPLADLIFGQASSIDQQLQVLSFGGVDLRSLGFLVLLSLAFVQILRGQFFAPAVTLLWNALQMLVMETKREPRDPHKA